MKNFIFPFKKSLLLEKKNNISIEINENNCIIKSIKDDSIFSVCTVEKMPNLNYNNYHINGFTHISASKACQWNNIKITLIGSEDICYNFFSWISNEQLQRQNYTDYINYANLKKDLELFNYDKNGNVVQKWTLLGSQPISLNFSNDFMYNEGFVNSHIQVEMELSFDKALLVY